MLNKLQNLVELIARFVFKIFRNKGEICGAYRLVTVGLVGVCRQQIKIRG